MEKMSSLDNLFFNVILRLCIFRHAENWCRIKNADRPKNLASKQKLVDYNFVLIYE